MEKPKIVYKKKVKLTDVPDEKGGVLKRFYYEIELDNGSQWVCDSKGENWKRVKSLATKNESMTDDDLLTNFLGSRKNL